MDGGPQHPDRHSLGDNYQRGVDATIREELVLLPTRSLSSNTPTTAALLQQTRTIPIVFATVGDPIGSGFVASFPRPGGNVTGFITVEGSLGGKWLELLKEIAPRVNRVAFLLNPSTATYAKSYLNAFKAAAASVAVQAIAAPVHDRFEFDAVIQAREPNGLIVLADAFTVTHPSASGPASLQSLPSPCHLSVPSFR